MCFLYFASSEIFSAIISKAPDIASSADFTPFSSLIYFDASSSILPVNFPSLISSANGVNPFPWAIVALVLFLGLYGLYISSTSVKVCAFSSAFPISSVNFSCSSISLLTSAFLSCKFLK